MGRSAFLTSASEVVKKKKMFSCICTSWPQTTASLKGNAQLWRIWSSVIAMVTDHLQLSIYGGRVANMESKSVLQRWCFLTLRNKSWKKENKKNPISWSSRKSKVTVPSRICVCGFHHWSVWKQELGNFCLISRIAKWKTRRCRG